MLPREVATQVIFALLVRPEIVVRRPEHNGAVYFQQKATSMADGDLRDQISRIESDIEQLAKT